MARLKPWLSRWPKARYPGLVQHGTDEVAEADSPNPTEIYGLSVESSRDSLISRKILVAVPSKGSFFASAGTRDPLESDVGQEYGVKKDADGVWVVDLSETVNTRIKILDVSIERGLYFWDILSNYQQE